MPNKLPPLRLSQMPGFTPVAKPGTPEFTAFVRASFPDIEARAALARRLAQGLEAIPNSTPVIKGDQFQSTAQDSLTSEAAL